MSQGFKSFQQIFKSFSWYVRRKAKLEWKHRCSCGRKLLEPQMGSPMLPKSQPVQHPRLTLTFICHYTTGECKKLAENQAKHDGRVFFSNFPFDAMHTILHATINSNLYPRPHFTFQLRIWVVKRVNKVKLISCQDSDSWPGLTSFILLSVVCEGLFTCFCGEGIDLYPGKTQGKHTWWCIGCEGLKVRWVRVFYSFAGHMSCVSWKVWKVLYESSDSNCRNVKMGIEFSLPLAAVTVEN